MHYHAEVWIESDKNDEKQVKEAMAPYHERGKGFWEWYQVGGRWKGVHVPGYKAEDDPENQKNPCTWCNGTGTREDTGKKCNACDGKGVGTKWPTEWQPHAKDVIPVAEIPDTLAPFTLVLPGKVFHREEYHPEEKDIDRKFQETEFAKKTVKQVLQEEKITSGYLVTVDYHS